MNPSLLLSICLQTKLGPGSVGYPPATDGDFGLAANNYCLESRDKTGARVWIMLDTMTTQSFAIAPSLLGQDALVKFGNGTLGKFRFLKGDFAGVQAVLGMDALWNLAIGCGYIEKLTVWPKGDLSEAQIKKWLFDDMGYPGVGDREFVSVPIGRSEDGLPTISVEVGGKRCTALLRLGYGQTCLPPVEAVLAKGPVSFELASRGLVGNLPIPWIKMEGNSLSSPVSRDPSVTGTISLDNLGSKRILVDFPARKIYVERLPTEARASFILSQIMRAPVMITHTGLKVGGPMSSEVKTVLQGFDMLGCNVVSIAGSPASEISRMAGSDTPEAVKWLADFLERVQPMYALRYLKNGEVRQYNIPANPAFSSKGPSG